jgi:hypothetical protein
MKFIKSIILPFPTERGNPFKIQDSPHTKFIQNRLYILSYTSQFTRSGTIEGNEPLVKAPGKPVNFDSGNAKSF